MHNVIFKTEGGEDVNIFAVGGETILELAYKKNIPIDAPCAGNGTCGKCRVKVLEGEDSQRPADSDCNDLRKTGLNSDREDGWRLACEFIITGDTVVYVPDIASAYIKNITTEVYCPDPGESPSRKLTVEPMYGLAVDIGTTTVSALLVEMETGHTYAKSTTGNSQIRYGADVINRIIQQQKPDGVKKLQEAIVQETLVPLIDNLCASTGITRDKIIRMTVASNTTMNHLLLGIDANSIRIEPYEPAFLEFEPYDPSGIGIDLAPAAKMILAPNIGSYVGGDITAGVLSAATNFGVKMCERPEMTLLIDLGTNGEIVYGNDEFLMACACSAGPAFEGGDISSGMRATDGAIEACSIEKDTMEPKITVIGDVKPAGLCGSGLIDAVAELFRTGIINGKGKISREGKRIRRDEYGTGSYVLVFAKDTATNTDIIITEVDIDNFIRAKGAIFSGIMSLLAPLGFTPADIDDVMIAGGIGSGINVRNAISIGMLPDLPENKYSYIGNSSLSGAYEMLTVPGAEERLQEIAGNMTYIELSTQPGYMDEFIAACFLPHTDETLFPSLLSP